MVECEAQRLQYTIRPMEGQDLPAVVAAERLCHPCPWSAELFQRELGNPLARIDLLSIDGELAGYLCFWLVCGELQIHNVATVPRFRRRGVAAHLLRQVFAQAAEGGVEKVFLEVRTGNVGAIALYRAFGFTDTAIRKGYYPDGEDALLMEISRKHLLSFLSVQGESRNA